MIYDVRLKISHDYAQPAGNGRHMVRVLPKTMDGRQRLTAHILEVFPEPDARSDDLDFFGNVTTSIAHINPHDEMEVRLACRVEQLPPMTWLDVSPDVAQLRLQWEGLRDIGPASPLHFLGPSPRLAATSEIAQFARDLFIESDSTVANVIRIGMALHNALTFDSAATTVDTDARDAFAQKRGVCQDFTHIMILALRSLGIPSGYVSGYLRTLPPEGGERLEGADAMHAWVRAWCGTAQDWIEYDPTNALLVGSDHIVVGYGRDYSDVSPIIGHLRSSGGQTNAQSVDVAIVD